MFKLDKNIQNWNVKKVWDEPVEFRKIDRSKFHIVKESVNIIITDSNEKANEMIKALVEKTVIACRLPKSWPCSYGKLLPLLLI